MPRKVKQKEYDRLLITSLEKDIKNLERAVKLCEESIPRIYEKMHRVKRPFVQPVILSDNEYAELWRYIVYKRKPLYKEYLLFTTARHETVRSKSEVIIADTLNRLGVPYRYEYPLHLQVTKKN